MRYLLVFMFLIFLSMQLNAQYISEDGEIDRESMISDLKQYKSGSEEQSELRNDILKELVTAARSHPAIQDSDEMRSEVILTIMDLGNKRGDFFFLSPRYEAHREREERKANDTISMDLLMLEGRLAAMQDSIRGIYQELKVIVEDEGQTRATREKAITLVATSNDLNDIEYIFENSSNHFFTDMGGGFSDDQRGGHRTGMNALYLKKIPGSGVMNINIEDHNWILFPFLIKYWGDPEWNKRVGSEKILEYVIARRMFLSDLNRPDLLIEFMRANAEDPDTPIFKMLDRF